MNIGKKVIISLFSNQQIIILTQQWKIC